MIPFRADSIDELLSACSPAVRRLIEAARKRIRDVVPEATEKLRAGWGLIGYNAPAYFAFIEPRADDIRIGFEWGVLLSDPAEQLDGGGSQVRYLPIRAVRALASPAVADLLREAAALRPPRRSRRK